MIWRLAIVGGIAVAVALAFWVGKWVALRRSRLGVVAHGWNDADFSDATLTVVLFTGPRCAQCDAQRSAIAAARENRPNVGYREFNAGVDTELARRLAVMSVPTTLIVDSAGNVLSRNGRLVDSTVLTRQLVKALTAAA